MSTDLSQRLPTADETEKAAAAARALAQTTTDTGAVSFRVTDDNTVELPEAVGQIVLDLLLHIAKGEAVTFVPFGADLTTQQAADMLNVSRPFLIKLLEKGELKSHKVGTHRRIKAAEAIAYRNRRESDQKAALAELAELGQDIDAK